MNAVRTRLVSEQEQEQPGGFSNTRPPLSSSSSFSMAFPFLLLLLPVCLPATANRSLGTGAI